MTNPIAPSVPLHDYEPRTDERFAAVAAYVGWLVLTPLVPALVWAFYPTSRWVRRQAAGAFNFAMSTYLIIAGSLVIALMVASSPFAFMGFALAAVPLVVVILSLVYGIMGAHKSFNGFLFEPPTVHRFLR